jgi:hypothetical protein
VDATLPAIKFPVLLAPEHNEPGEAEASVDMGGGCLQLSLVHNRSWRQLIYLEYVGLALQPLQLLLEQNTAARLVRLCASLLEELAALQPLLDQDAATPAAAAVAPAAGAAAPATGTATATGAPAAAPRAMAAPGAPSGAAAGGTGEAGGGDGGEEAEAAGAHLVQELFLRELHLHPVSISCTVGRAAARRPAPPRAVCLPVPPPKASTPRRAPPTVHPTRAPRPPLAAAAGAAVGAVR